MTTVGSALPTPHLCMSHSFQHAHGCAYGYEGFRVYVGMYCECDATENVGFVHLLS